MITASTLVRLVEGLQAEELNHWIAENWVRPQRREPEPEFGEIDVARVKLIVELRHDLDVSEEALPIVLSLLDQLYEARRQMRLICETIERAGPEELRQAIGTTATRALP